MFKALILLDDGSTTSYISTSLAKKLKLPSQGTKTLNFNVFNELSSRQVKTDLVYFSLKLKNGSQFKMFAQTIPHISAPLSYMSVDSYNFDSSSIECGSPDILIGSDFYYDFNITPSHKLSSGLTVSNLEFGQIVAGPSNLNVAADKFTYVVLFSLNPNIIDLKKKFPPFLILN